ncbi:N-formylglutamate amidohydrolase [Sphingomonas profundi]|uniref:N-formylglutamate amidohydrolase n=1 Tax=Alterirhizorhabdus profundi TaxID=2681549 RepID=UPI0012E87B19|nr:N-formylglutamate amidohydrolase [Sphingomonas profundi]
MEAGGKDAGPFARVGLAVPATPLVFSVPHAGRHYPPDLIAASLLPVEALAALEDRHADLLAEGLPALGATGFVARHARAWIDLNRDERELDPAMLAAPPRPGRLVSSAKVRGGLGLIPRRILGAGDIWSQRLADADVDARIAGDHRPWHAAIAAALHAARARFGVALLIDLHSMPPLSVGGARIVIGDRHGRSSAPHLVDRLRTVVEAAGRPVALNLPYAGGHTVERHGRPRAGIHAIQVEIDRSLYLAPDLRTPGEGLPATRALVCRMAQAMLHALAEGQPAEAALAAE